MSSPSVLTNVPKNAQAGFLILRTADKLGSIEPEERKALGLEIIQRYLTGESTATIAESYGVHRTALGQLMLKHCEEDWKEAQVARAIASKEAAEDDLEDKTATPDALSLARARERLKAAQWNLEKLCRRLYGQDAPNVQVAASITIVHESA